MKRAMYPVHAGNEVWKRRFSCIFKDDEHDCVEGARDVLVLGGHKFDELGWLK